MSARNLIIDLMRSQTLKSLGKKIHKLRLLIGVGNIMTLDGDGKSTINRIEEANIKFGQNQKQ